MPLHARVTHVPVRTVSLFKLIESLRQVLRVTERLNTSPETGHHRDGVVNEATTLLGQLRHHLLLIPEHEVRRRAQVDVVAKRSRHAETQHVAPAKHHVSKH